MATTFPVGENIVVEYGGAWPVPKVARQNNGRVLADKVVQCRAASRPACGLPAVLLELGFTSCHSAR
jgi:hypothetical protein